jgi:hypothetical protein
MKNEMPPSTTIAPAAIAIALPPDRPLSGEEVVVVGVTFVLGVLDVGALTGPCGNPGDKGLLDWATAAAGHASITAANVAASPTHPRRPRFNATTRLRERLLHRRRFGRIDVGMLFGDVFLVVDALGVDRPQVVVARRQYVLHGAHRGQH